MMRTITSKSKSRFRREGVSRVSQTECCKGFGPSKVLMLLSWACVVLAAIGAFGVDIYLASTQWILMSVFLAVNALWFHYHKGL